MVLTMQQPASRPKLNPCWMSQNYTMFSKHDPDQENCCATNLSNIPTEGGFLRNGPF